jgi:hypothetical protein
VRELSRAHLLLKTQVVSVDFIVQQSRQVRTQLGCGAGVARRLPGRVAAEQHCGPRPIRQDTQHGAKDGQESDNHHRRSWRQRLRDHSDQWCPDWRPTK